MVNMDIMTETMFKTACFRLEPPFIHFIKENACYTHTEDEPVRAITGLITATNAIYRDSENLYREAIAQKMCIRDRSSFPGLTIMLPSELVQPAVPLKVMDG